MLVAGCTIARRLRSTLRVRPLPPHESPQSQMEYWNSGEGDNITKVRGKIDEVKDVMINNIDQVLKRGEKIELLVDKTEQLNQSAFKFQRQSKVRSRVGRILIVATGNAQAVRPRSARARPTVHLHPRSHPPRSRRL